MADLSGIVIGRHHFRGKCDTRDCPFDILAQIQTLTFADNMTNTDIGEGITGRGDPHRIEQVAIAFGPCPDHPYP